MPPSAIATVNDDDGSSIHSNILSQFRPSKTFGQVMNLYNTKTEDADEEYVLLDINLYLKQEALPSSLGRFNSRVSEQCWSKRTFALKSAGWMKLLVLRWGFTRTGAIGSWRAFWMSIF
jgi:hypothetical protein